MRFELTTLTLASDNCLKTNAYIHNLCQGMYNMANIRQLQSGNWNVQVRRSKSAPRSQTFHTQEEAIRWAIREEGVDRFTHPTFEEAGLKFCDTVLQGKPSQRLTSLQVRRIAKHPRMAKPMDRITSQDVNSYKKQRALVVCSTTLRDDLLKVRRVFRWYVSELFAEFGLVLDNPCDAITLPKARRPRDKVVSRSELKLLLGAMSPEMAQIVELAFETAMRRSEILRLVPNDLCLGNRFLRVVDGKEGSRDVPLTKRAVELLSDAVRGATSHSAPLFPVAAYSVTQAVRRARETLGMSSDVRFHQLRHSRITEVARMGLNQAQIMVVSGHRDIRSVQRYTHLNVRDVIGLID